MLKLFCGRGLDIPCQEVCCLGMVGVGGGGSGDDHVVVMVVAVVVVVVTVVVVMTVVEAVVGVSAWHRPPRCISACIGLVGVCGGVGGRSGIAEVCRGGAGGGLRRRRRDRGGGRSWSVSVPGVGHRVGVWGRRLHLGMIGVKWSLSWL